MYTHDTQNSYFNVPPSLKTNPETKKKWHQKWWGRAIIIFLAVFLIILTAVVFYVGKVVVLLRSGEITPAQLFGNEFSSAQSGSLSTLVTLDDPNFGPKDSQVVIVEFADFQCLACHQAHVVVKEILKDYGDKVFFVFRDFPVVADHPEALIAALAAECANEQGGFWRMHDKIFAAQDDITESSLKTYAVQIGLNISQFNNCLASGKYVEEIEQDLNEGYEAGVRATPTFFINGARVPGAIPLATFERIIIDELSR